MNHEERGLSKAQLRFRALIDGSRTSMRVRSPDPLCGCEPALPCAASRPYPCASAAQRDPLVRPNAPGMG